MKSEKKFKNFVKSHFLKNILQKKVQFEMTKYRLPRRQNSEIMKKKSKNVDFSDSGKIKNCTFSDFKRVLVCLSILPVNGQVSQNKNRLFSLGRTITVLSISSVVL